MGTTLLSHVHYWIKAFCDKKMVMVFGVDVDLQGATMHTRGNAATTHLGHTLDLKVHSLGNSYTVDMPNVFSVANISAPKFNTC